MQHAKLMSYSHSNSFQSWTCSISITSMFQNDVCVNMAYAWVRFSHSGDVTRMFHEKLGNTTTVDSLAPSPDHQQHKWVLFFHDGGAHYHDHTDPMRCQLKSPFLNNEQSCFKDASVCVFVIFYVALVFKVIYDYFLIWITFSLIHINVYTTMKQIII